MSPQSRSGKLDQSDSRQAGPGGIHQELAVLTGVNESPALARPLGRVVRRHRGDAWDFAGVHARLLDSLERPEMAIVRAEVARVDAHRVSEIGRPGPAAIDARRG